MRSPRSIRLRLALATAGVLLVFGGVFGIASYRWFKASLDEQTRSFALHEAQEIANVAAPLRNRAEVEAQRATFDGLFPEEGVVGLAIFDLDGRLVLGLPDAAGPWAASWDEGFRAAREGTPRYDRVTSEGHPHSVRTAMLVNYRREPRWLVTALVSEERALAALERYRTRYGASLALALAFGFFGCLIVLSVALRPIGRLVDDAAQLAAGEPGAHLVEPPEGSELRELVVLLNRMLERDRNVVESLRRFTAHASHELRTPLARIRGEAELAIGGDVEQQRECITSVLDETEELGRMIDALLELARAESDDVDDAKPFPILPLLEELAEQARVVGDPRDVSVIAAAGDVLWVRGNRVLLVRALWNLVDNAIKFGAPKGRIELRLRSDPKWNYVEVADDGPGLDEANAEALFEPFARGDARGNGAFGHGLGLALSRAVVRRCGGDVWVRRDALGGACFVVRLPGAA